jgi:tRNA/tmRNA/rRNA uracil-C5-methylase (TrmA/RlmC/RlmD family)
MNVGDELEVEIGDIAHGGHCVARYSGRVIFVRHAIPGERVLVKITELSKNFARADCIQVINPSRDRAEPKCKFARPGGCGGCDFQHIGIALQRTLKAKVIEEQFNRLAKLAIKVEVEEVPPTIGWRSRMEFNISKSGKVAMFRSRSNELIEIDSCKIADSRISIDEINSKKLAPGTKVEAIVDGEGEVQIVDSRSDRISYEVSERDFSISPQTFWQSHSAAPALLSKVVTELAEYKTGDHVVDLYAGVGVLSASALKVIGAGGRLTLIEESESAISDARWNFAGEKNVEIQLGKVERAVKDLKSCDVVVLDPPRSGAGAKVMDSIAKLSPRSVIYVACDPAALARDTHLLQTHTYKLDALRAFDLFPMTQHIECVARFIKP